MKKILVIVMTAFFAVSAFAVDVKLRGSSEISGKWYNNAGLSKESKNDQAFYYQWIRFWVDMDIDENISIHLRTTPLGDRVWGTKWSEKSKDTWFQDTFKLDRAFVKWRPFADDTFIITAGRQDVNRNYVVNFGAHHINHEGSVGSAGEGIILEYTFNDMVTLKGTVVKLRESQLNPNYHDSLGFRAHPYGHKKNQPARTLVNEDHDAYILMAKVSLDNLDVAGSFGFQKKLGHSDLLVPDPNNPAEMIRNRNVVDLKDYARYSYNLGAVLDLNRFEVKAAVDGYSMKYEVRDGKGWNKVSYAPFGLYLDGAVKGDGWKAGLLTAFGSAGKIKDGDFGVTSFGFGKSFDKTYLVDSQYFPDTGAQGMTTVQAYGNYTPAAMPNLTLDAVFAFYKSNLKKVKGANDIARANELKVLGLVSNGLLFTHKTNIFEIDLAATYQVSKSTKVVLGAAYAINKDLYNASDVANAAQNSANKIFKDVPNVLGLRWQLLTNF